MAGHGQELRLGAVGLLGLTTRLLQFNGLSLQRVRFVFEAQDQRTRIAHRLPRSMAQPLRRQSDEGNVETQQVHRRGDAQTIGPQGPRRLMERDPDRVA